MGSTPGIRPASSALEGGFLILGPPVKYQKVSLLTARCQFHWWFSLLLSLRRQGSQSPHGHLLEVGTGEAQAAWARYKQEEVRKVRVCVKGNGSISLALYMAICFCSCTHPVQVLPFNRGLSAGNSGTQASTIYDSWHYPSSWSSSRLKERECRRSSCLNCLDLEVKHNFYLYFSLLLLLLSPFSCVQLCATP